MHYETVSLLTLSVALCAGLASAQEVNVLGLPAVPQNRAAPAGTASAPGGKASTAASSAKGAASQPRVVAMTDNDIKGILNGGVAMASFYDGSIARVRVTSNAQYSASQRKQVLHATRLVQRDVAVACGKQCKSARMVPAQFLPSGQVIFDLEIDGLGRTLSGDDMKAMLMGQPMPVVAKPASAASAAVPAAKAAASASN
jgi:hypothetical protein